MSSGQTILTPAGRRTGDIRDGGRRTPRTVVEPAGAGVASAIARRMAGRRAGWTFLTTALAGYALLAAALVGSGLLLTHALLRVHAVAAADESVPSWMARHREGWLTTASDVASRIGDVPTLPALVLVVLIVALVVHRLRIGVFLVTAILMEVTLYRIGALAVPRDRPGVARLDALPADESFPSGHVAASVVVYAGLALLIGSWSRRRWAGPAAWTLAVVFVLGVAAARIYRGMHHPLDAVSGALLGIGCLAVALLAVRAYGHVRRIRADGPSGGRSARR